MKNGTVWLDDQNKPIQAHGGMIIEHEGTWYWYGENKGAENLPVSGIARVDVIGISCYSSKNLISWHFEGLALAAVHDDPNSVLAPNRVCERPKVLYNAKTKQFVMWVHLDDADYIYAGIGVAVSDRPVGPFHLIRAKQPNRQDSRDMTLFQDIDGTAYLVHSSNWNNTLNIARLTDDYTDVDGFYVSVLIDQTREAPALLYDQGLYYMVTSGCTGWAPNSALVATCPHLLGQWKLIDNPCEGPDYRMTFYGQSTYIFRVKGKPFLMLDHWKPQDLKNSAYSILPISIVDGQMTIRWQDEFDPGC